MLNQCKIVKKNRPITLCRYLGESGENIIHSVGSVGNEFNVVVKGVTTTANGHFDLKSEFCELDTLLNLT